ncbi:predicted protein [Naegleria gruberi]|uniref:Predicted protein n=1 Tax=Naegleria gruberi TaxID=5762 RepID=D2W058_NAEGR|nr:uncharacterized protein NAEGRDRAFT_74741 [Naegleria gruberi]EFC37515.1 predicted protein [Naegleria gruberi]|eukprot:XP_002670259.1 predicted protein [Naegleria gruberi strain NEG-M]
MNEHDEIYVISDRANEHSYSVEKFKLGEFIRNKNAPAVKPVWITSDTCSNTYGSVVFNGVNTRYLIILDNFESNLKIFDYETGSLINNTIFSVYPYAYSLGKISNKEIVVGCSKVY